VSIADAQIAAAEAERGRPLYSFEVSALKREHRTVPIGEGGGACRWCGKAILGKRGKYIGKPDPARSWCRDDDGHSACLREYNLHSRADFQHDWLAEHHGLKCAGCRVVNPTREIDCGWGRAKTTSALEVDHIEPLWWIALTVPRCDRRRYFGPANLQLLCPPCHKRKSRREAAERALMKRQLSLF
jgi:5-methylcytosine-specific restriction endonuclease McrA